MDITDLRRNIFHTRNEIKDNICSMIIDCESGANVISSYMVDMLELTCIKNNGFGELKATKQCMISFSIGSYSDNVLCDVIPLQDCHIMLGRPWQFDRNVIYDKGKNRVSFELNKRKYKLVPLTPSQVYEDQKCVKEAMKDFERENNGRSKEVHVDIRREEKEEVVLCGENELSSEIKRKEKRDDHESKKERDGCEEEREKQESLNKVISYSNSNIPTSSSSYFDSFTNTHGNICIKKSSLNKLIPKVVQTKYLIEQVHVDEKYKGKENCFGSFQDKTRDKKIKNTVVNLLLMQKE